MLFIIILGLFCGYSFEINSSPEELYLKANQINETYEPYNGEVSDFLKQENYKIKILNWSKDTLAVSYLQKVIKEAPNYYQAYIELANIYMKREKHNEAFMVLSKVDEDFNDNFRKLEIEGFAYYKLENKKMAANKYKEILENQKNSDAFFYVFV